MQFVYKSREVCFSVVIYGVFMRSFRAVTQIDFLLAFNFVAENVF